MTGIGFGLETTGGVVTGVPYRSLPGFSGLLTVLYFCARYPRMYSWHNPEIFDLWQADSSNIRLAMAPRNALICRCDTRSHLARELADWRADYVGSVVPGG
jgi:hypothetical protein